MLEGVTLGRQQRDLTEFQDTFLEFASCMRDNGYDMPDPDFSNFGQPGQGLVHHSDRGSQYASKVYREILAAQGIACSMSRAGDCYDNALKESFFHTLKVESVHGEDFATRADARAAVFEYLEVFYNRQRLHSALGYMTPEEFEAAYHAAA